VKRRNTRNELRRILYFPKETPRFSTPEGGGGPGWTKKDLELNQALILEGETLVRASRETPESVAGGSTRPKRSRPLERRRDRNRPAIKLGNLTGIKRMYTG